MKFEIVDLATTAPATRKAAAELLVAGFRENWPEAWPTLASAVATVDDCIVQERVSRVALGDGGHLFGWTCAAPEYAGRSWELLIIVVDAAHRRHGVGRALLTDLEARVGQRGGLSIWLGSDDENEMTSIAGIDLYPDVLDKLSAIENVKGHPFEFYRKLGYSIVGVIPDANGIGKPDILMAKRLI